MLTDLKADAEILPLNPPIETWVGHKVRMIIFFFKGMKRCLVFVVSGIQDTCTKCTCVETCN